jgi:tetratricopeptide (TPR) repeat protein
MYLLFLAFLAQLALLAQSTDFNAEGVKALDARNYDAAVAAFTQAVTADQKDPSAHFNLALSYSMLGKDAQAIPEYKAVLAIQPGLYEAQLNLGVTLIRAKDPAAAISYLQQATHQKPNEYRPAFSLAEALFATNQFKEAEVAYAAAIALNSTSAPAVLGLGRSLARQGRLSQAEPHYRKAAMLDIAYHDALIELASLYEDAKQAPEAIAIYREFPGNPGAEERMGVLLLESGKSAEAIAPLEAAVAQSPTPANRLALAQAYVHDKQTPKAEPLVAQALQAAPEDVPLRMFYGRLLRDQRKFPEAAAQFLAATQRQPDLVEAWNELAGVYLISDQFPQALAAFDRVRALGGETTANFFFRAMAFDRLHQAKDALENYNRFLAESHGEHPDQEFQARQRKQTLEKELGKR